MRIFVTGGTGYIGAALCRKLAAEGHELHCLVRPTSDASALAGLGAALHVGDVTDRASMRGGMSGADWVVHAAAELSPEAPPERMERVNVGGSENAASLAYKLGVGRFLSLSSMAYFGGSPPDGSPGTEESPLQLPFPSPYSATKHAGERAVRRWAERGLRINTVYPSLVYGPPGKREGANAVLRGLLRRRFPALVGADRWTSWVFVDDAVEGIVRVAERAAPGRAYLLAGDSATVEDLAHRACALAGVAPPRWKVPVSVARVAAVLGAPVYRLAGRRPPLPRAQIRSLSRHWRFDDSRARSELGWRPRTLDQGLPPTVAFLQGRG